MAIKRKRKVKAKVAKAKVAKKVVGKAHKETAKSMARLYSAANKARKKKN